MEGVKMQNLAAIVGPTAVGKSKIAVEVAGMLDAEIISADSVQVYKGLDIGTAKISHAERFTHTGKYIPHYMLDVVEPNETYSVAQYKVAVEELIAQISAKGKLPLLVGGTGLYVQAVIDPYKFEPIPVDWEYRKKLQQLAQEKGNEFIHSQLAKVDPISAKKLHPNDLRRIIRALEVYQATGKPIWADHQVGKKKSRYNLSIIGINMPRPLLYERIEQRVEKMIAQGLIAEVKDLLNKGYSSNLPAMQSIGYKQICFYLKGKCTLEEAINLIKRDTRRLAKRQLTWFRRDKRIKWFENLPDQEEKRIVSEIVAEIGRTIYL